MQVITSQNGQTELTSWKEIATYLQKAVRTAQRWEAQFGLPVQRPDPLKKSIVRASREDLDRWMATRWSSRAGKPDARVVSDIKCVSVRKEIETSHLLRAERRRLLGELRQQREKLRRELAEVSGRKIA
ncbi:MAG: hypothetical protein ROO76_13345 [Terriglobia bacterium]|jgi:hypothetical protein|nr:hypothetical protein [Terriglobia bacterium]